MKRTSHGLWIGIATIGVILVALAAVFLIAPRVQSAAVAQTGAAPTYQTAAVKTGDLGGSIGATGVVRSGQTATLVWQTTGIVQKVAVTKGQVVDANTVLAELDPTSLPQQVILAQASLVSAQKALDNLLNTNQARANAELALDKAQKALDDANKARNNKQFQVASQETIDIARANLILANHGLDDAATIFNRNKDRSDTDVVFAAALSQYAAAQQRYDSAKYNYDYVSGLPSTLDVQTAQALVDVAQANVLAAKLEWDRQKDGPNEQDVAAARAQVDAAQAILNLAHVAAPFHGTVSTATSKVGDQIAPGSVAFQIDDLSSLYVDVDVAQVDIPGIQLGQAAELTLDAFPGQAYPGKVTDIATSGHTVAGTVNFTVTIQISGQAPGIKPGMTASAQIDASQAQAGLLVPGQAVRVQDGKQVVYLLKNGTPVPVQIAIGAVSGSMTIVTAGDLHAGDLVILNPPALPSAPVAGQ
jgi:HlyD family secretion protein